MKAPGTRPAGKTMINFINRILTKIFGSTGDRAEKELRPVAEQVNSFEGSMRKLGDEELVAKTGEFRSRLSEGETLDDLLPEAFAVCREASRRVLKTAGGVAMRHFDVQIMGGVALHRGQIAEMSTGEGKTLVATLACYLNALEQKGVHVVTVNDYLAQRDRDWMAPLFEFLGLTSGAIQGEMDSVERLDMYACDITYGTNNEFGFDYLRDNMKIHLEQQVQGRGRNFAIVDEVDSILIDEARTPLIISGPAEKSTDKYHVADRVAKRLVKGQDFELKEKERSIVFTEAGIEKAEGLVGVKSFYVGKDMEWPHLLEQALKAHHVYHRDDHYLIDNGEVKIIDEFTGRALEGRSWSEGLHQAVEAKEGLQIRRENQTLATITLQNYFKLYSKLSGMTGTALTEAVEFDGIYKLRVAPIPTNKPLVRDDLPDVVYMTAREKYYAIVEEIDRVNKLGRPILVGTTSVEKSELLSDMLKRRGIKHYVLNAKHHDREADIVAEAGQASRVTLSTNMAGRGTDIVLGEGVVERGGLHVVGTERHESRRIDNQLRGRCARQGDPGSSIFFLSLEDDLMRRFAGDKVQSMLKKIGMKEGEEISHPWVSRSIAKAQKKVEAYHFDIRKNLLEYDGVMNEQRTIVYDQRQIILEGDGLSGMVQEMMDEVCSLRVRDFLSMETIEESVEAGGEVIEAYDPVDDLENWARSSYGIEAGLQLDTGKSQVDHFGEFSDKILSAYQESYVVRTAANGEENMRRAERFILLMELDDKWKDHLHAMDTLRHAIGLRGYAQIDPKIAYKREGYEMFSEMLDNFRSSVTQLVLRVQVGEEDEQELDSGLDEAEFQHSELAPGAQPESPMQEASDPSRQAPVKTIVNKSPKVKRNDPCPCGSGKKFKKCCGMGS